MTVIIETLEVHDHQIHLTLPDEWENRKVTVRVELEGIRPRPGIPNPDRFRGLLNLSEQEVDEYIEKLRGEWEFSSTVN